MAARKPRKLREILLPAIGAAFLVLLAGAYLGHHFTHAISGFADKARILVADARHPPQTRPWRYTGSFGLHVGDPASASGHILVSAYFMDDNKIEIRLIEVKSGKVLKTWRPDPAELKDRSRTTYYAPERFSPMHPMPMADGGLVFVDRGGPLVRIDACSRIVWVAEGHFDHALNRDLAGNFIVPVAGAPLEGPYARIMNDSVARVDRDGRRVATVSVARMLIDNGMASTLAIPLEFVGGNGPDVDAIHLNDVEVAQKDGAFWKRGDWMLSLRNLNLVMIWRPSTKKIVWQRTGPWQKQHDPDFDPDGSISVFGNDVFGVDGQKAYLRGHSDIYVIAPDGSVSTPYTGVMAAESVGTRTQGLHRILPSGDVFIEETDEGRIVFLDENGIKWRFNNTDGKRGGALHWSRYYPEGQLPDGILTPCKE